MNKGASLLADRAVIAVTGADAEAFLNRLVTNSIVTSEARFAALLTPQGKIIADFFVVPVPGSDGFLVDCPAPQAADLLKRLTIQRLRAKVALEDRSDAFAIAAAWGASAPQADGAIVFDDPRAERMGQRVIAPRDVLTALIAPDEAAYAAHRIACGVPQGGVDFVYGDSFVQETNLDHAQGVDFKKGCYVGQEVVARVHFRKSARKRTVKVHFIGTPPAPGTSVLAGETALGTIGSVAGQEGLAMLRLDKLEDARASGVVIAAGTATLEISVPNAFLEGAALAKAAS